jgi:sugar/nucleoside kinase (ribokinase family)
MTVVVSLGAHIVDVLARPVETLPDGQVAAIVEEIRATAAGTAAGTSVDLAKLGADVIAMGAVGDDELADLLAALLARHGVDASRLVRKQSAQTSASMLPIRTDGERLPIHCVGANGELTLDDVDLDVVGAADFLHYGGAFTLPKLDGEPAVRLLRHAKQHGVVTTMDMLGFRGPDTLEALTPCLQHVDWLLPNYEQARRLTGIDAPSEIAAELLRRGAGGVVVKLDSRGSLLATADGEETIPAYDVVVADTTGCGDAYCAGFIVGLGLGWEPREAARLGSAAGALVATGLGSDAGIVDLDSTIEFMRTASVRETAGVA